ncbi:hypothetical protein B0T14DRAFT_146991 [Immersiella caudata]|uniref:Secreted protein n=1 Tax=Immersiella caudata TaxID=314043 RepID=A0AA40C1W6_9PEZI|nr:hypothetical protein B0T14DRAFT_146991 [Immersiella caudata]
MSRLCHVALNSVRIRFVRLKLLLMSILASLSSTSWTISEHSNVRDVNSGGDCRAPSPESLSTRPWRSLEMCRRRFRLEGPS